MTYLTNPWIVCPAYIILTWATMFYVGFSYKDMDKDDKFFMALFWPFFLVVKIALLLFKITSFAITWPHDLGDKAWKWFHKYPCANHDCDRKIPVENCLCLACEKMKNKDIVTEQTPNLKNGLGVYGLSGGENAGRIASLKDCVREMTCPKGVVIDVDKLPCDIQKIIVQS